MFLKNYWVSRGGFYQEEWIGVTLLRRGTSVIDIIFLDGIWMK